MGKKPRRNVWTEQKIHRYQKEGRGKGIGKEYLPWLNRHDFRSTAPSSRLFGTKTGRLHIFFSGLERNGYLIFSFCDIVTDIREQFPLDRNETRIIAATLGVRHPKDFRTKIDIVMTTDILVTFVLDGKTKYLALAFKPSSALRDPRVKQKLEIERIYWQNQKVIWAVLTEQDLNRTLVGNMQWIYPYYYSYGLILPENYSIRETCEIILKSMSCANDLPLPRFCSQVGLEHNWDKGTTLPIVRHLLARKIITCDYMSSLAFEKNANEFHLNNNLYEVSDHE